MINVNKKMQYLIIIFLIFLVSCGRVEEIDKESVEEKGISSIVYNDFLEAYKYTYDPIPVDIVGDGVYLDDKLIYRNKYYVARDGFEYVKVADRYFLLFKKDYVENSEIKLNYSAYTGAVRAAIDEIDGMPWAMRYNVDQNKYKLLNDAGLYAVVATADDYTKVLDEKLLVSLCNNNYDGMWVNITGFTGADNEAVQNASKTFFEERKLDKKNNYERFVVKNDVGRSEYRNYFNDKGGYTIVDGFVVPNLKSLEYMNALRYNERVDYLKIEVEVFKANNPSATVLEEGWYPRTIYSKGTFLPNGYPAWVSRVNGDRTANAYGEILYADCGKTFEDYKIYCGGTNVVFRGWKAQKNEEPDKMYMDVLRGKATLNDRQFVDLEVLHHNARNDDPRYYREKMFKNIAKEEESYNEQVAKKYEDFEKRREKVYN